MEQVLIMGSGPAGISAALYVRRSGMEPLVLNNGIGALEKAEKIENYYGLERPLSGKELYERLRGLRSQIALEKQLPSYFIFTNRTLFEMTCHQPETMEELRALYGVGEKNSVDYGQVFLDAILEFKNGIMK